MGNPGTRGPGQDPTGQDSSRRRGQGTRDSSKEEVTELGPPQPRGSDGGGPEKRADPGYNLKVGVASPADRVRLKEELNK